MKISKLEYAEDQASNPEQVVVWLDGRPWKTIEAEAVLRFRLAPGKELSESAIAELEAEDAFVRALKFGTAFCLRKPRSERETIDALDGQQFPQDAIERAMEDLREQALLSDARLAKKHAFKSRRTHTGPLRAGAELDARGVEEGVADAALTGLRDERWQEGEVRTLAKMRLSRMKDKSAGEKERKIGSYLLRRGFEPEIVESVLRELIGDADSSG